MLEKTVSWCGTSTGSTYGSQLVGLPVPVPVVPVRFIPVLPVLPVLFSRSYGIVSRSCTAGSAFRVPSSKFTYSCSERAPDSYACFQSIFDMRAEQLHLVECAHNDFMHEIALASFIWSSITANDFIWGKFSEFRICIS